MVDRDVMERLLGLLEEYLNDLESVRGISLDDYESDKRTKRFVERTLQIAIEACLDMGWHIIADEGLPEAESNREVFSVLAAAGVIEPGIVSALREMASFRNLIVHDYGTINDEIVYRILTERLGDFRDYARMIVEHLRRQ